MDISQIIDIKRYRWQRAQWIMIAALFFIGIVYLMVGEVFISPLGGLSHLEEQLLWKLRVPRLLAAMAIGAGLALSGAVLQVLLGNVLAEPGLLGISGGASMFMAGLLIFFPLMATPVGFMLAAIIGAMLFTLLLVSISRVMRLTTSRLLLLGVALGIMSSSVVTWAFYFSDDQSLRQLMYWLMGSVGGASWYHHILTIVMLPVAVWLCLKGRLLDKLMMGEVHARQLGVNVEKVRWRLIIAVAIIVGCAVALGGIIGFVGLVVPHLVRLALGSENRYLLPTAAICGAALMVVSDLLARTVLDSAELPVGVVTTTIGAPVFIWMLLKNHAAR
ncbi:vitamin B12 ABC transporter permease BtuC [Vibrio sonorensis]|uniref:vitamin B12 ABC transporter permease BtuC n=1 Tax=Vibrio sonorensis TaxID=1004316 RepID=UPI0008DA5325|nr:vitamin B12 ABC transporter permease BtuC [Vibrio sonorensis]